MEPTSKDVVAALFSKVTDAISCLEPGDWEAVVAGKFTVEILVNGGSSPRQHGSKVAPITLDLTGLRQALNETQSRHSALALLEERCPSKDGLLQLSRYL